MALEVFSSLNDLGFCDELLIKGLIFGANTQHSDLGIFPSTLFLYLLILS